jgi:hypothetical protein
MNFIVEWQFDFPPPMRATPERVVCSTREEAEQRKAKLHAQFGGTVVASIRPQRQGTPPRQLKLADNWPVQRRPKQVR